MTTLHHPRDLAAWQRWDASRRPARRLINRLRGRTAEAPGWSTLQWRGTPAVLVVLDSTSITSRVALLDPAMAATDLPGLAVLSAAPLPDLDAQPKLGRWNRTQIDLTALDRVAALAAVQLVVSAGNYLPLGTAADQWALTQGLRRAVVQHGLLTPFAPPLPHGAHLLAWSQDDSEFWRSGRDDLTSTVFGSALLARAASAGDHHHVSRFEPPIFLGQLHSAELGRAQMTWAASDFVLREKATYRPHPSERDMLSRMQHHVWERAGVRIDRSSAPLAQTRSPVVSVFSTGVLEAAARGVPAWVSHPRPPRWLSAFWERYDLHRWGQNPTPAPVLPTDPTAATAQWLTEQVNR